MIELSVDLQSNGKVNIDETSLLMLVKNLIQNAIIYTPVNGQVMVKLYQLEQSSDSLKPSALNASYNFGSHVIRSGKLNHLSKTFSSRLVWKIIDSGAGILPSDYENTFEPFVWLNQVSNVDEKLSNSISASRSDSASKQSQAIDRRYRTRTLNS